MFVYLTKQNKDVHCYLHILNNHLHLLSKKIFWSWFQEGALTADQLIERIEAGLKVKQ